MVAAAAEVGKEVVAAAKVDVEARNAAFQCVPVVQKLEDRALPALYCCARQKIFDRDFPDPPLRIYVTEVHRHAPVPSFAIFQDARWMRQLKTSLALELKEVVLVQLSLQRRWTASFPIQVLPFAFLPYSNLTIPVIGRQLRFLQSLQLMKLNLE